METAVSFISRHEGRRAHVYRDSLGIPTVAVGLNLLRADSRARLTAVGADYDKVLTGTEALTDQQIDTLLQQDIDACVADLRKIFVDFDTMPAVAKLIITDLRFNLGLHGLLGFPNTIADLRNHRWKDAADKLSQSKWATQVKSRATEDCDLLRSIV